MNYYNPSLTLAFASKHHSSKGKHSSKGHHSKNSGGKHSHKGGGHHSKNTGPNIGAIAAAHNQKLQHNEQVRKNHLASRHNRTDRNTHLRAGARRKNSVPEDARPTSGSGDTNSAGVPYDAQPTSGYTHAYSTSNINNSSMSTAVTMNIENVIQDNSNVLILGGLGGMIWMLMFPDGTSILGKKYGKSIGWGASLIMLGLGAYGMFKNTVPTKSNYSSVYSDALYFSPNKPIRTIANSRSFAAGPAVTGNQDTDVIIPQNITTGKSINGSRNPANDTNHAYSYVSDVY